MPEYFGEGMNNAMEGELGTGVFLAATGELSDPQVVFRVTKGCFGDVAALPVGGDTVRCAESVVNCFDRVGAV